MKTFSVRNSVRITTFARDAVGRVLRVTPVGYEVRLPNWQADEVHLDVYVTRDEVEPAGRRAEKCRCVFCR